MTVLLALLAAPLLVSTLGFGLGTVPAGPPPVVQIPPTIHLSLVGGGVEAGQHLEVQAVVTGVGGIREQGTVTFWVAGSSMKVGSVLDAASTAVANLGFVTAGPITVDASFVPSGSSVEASTSEAAFRVSPIAVTPFVTVDPATAGSPVPVHFGLNVGPSGYSPDGHVDVMIGVATVRSSFCILAPGGGTSVAGVWKCTATIPSLPAGNVELHVVLADSPYYSSSTYLVVPVAAAAAKASPASPKAAVTPAPTAVSSPAQTSAATEGAVDADADPEASAGSGGTAPLVTAEGTRTSSTSPSWLWIALLVIALAALIGAGGIVLRTIRRSADRSPHETLSTMTAQRVLIIGGNGIISGSVTRLAVERGMNVTLLNRGTSTLRPAIEGVETVVGDADDPASMRSAIGGRDFDAVVNFRAFHPHQVAADIELFSGRTGQYVFISSASAYQKPIAHLPIVESTPLRNPFWEYSRNKIACEDLLVAAYREHAFPMTIVRPSHTYDPTLIPLDGGWTVLDRMRRGVPIVIHGDGTSLWTLTHARDFARAFVGLLGNPHALGAPVQITSDESLTWDAIAGLFARALGADVRIVHVASEILAAEVDYGDGLLGDKAHSVVFDNSRVKSLVPGWQATIPFAEGVREIVDWHLADPGRQKVDAELDAKFDHLTQRFG